MTLTTSSFGDVVKHLERVAKGDGKTEGDLFEALMRSFLKTDELYRDRFRNVWLWMEYPERNGRGDFGVDIVAEEQDGGLCAIQCKFYPHTKLTKSHIDSFLEAGSRDEFDSMLLIYSGDGYGAKVEDALKGHGCRILDFMALAGSNMDWPNLAKGLTEVRQKPKYGLRDDQKDAVRDVKRGLESTDRGRMIMACGTGKTLVSLRLAEDMIGKGGLVLYAVPSISLMHQAIRYWSEQKRIPHSYVGVCSDPKVSHRTGREDTPDISISEMEIRVTTDPDKIAKSLKKTAGKLTVVFSTYQSMKAIVKAQEKAGTAFDLILCDEAHRTAGIEQGSMEDMSPFMLVHDEVDTKKRLYMTATPKIYGSAVRTKVARNDARPYSMDDESKFGPLLYEMGFAAAIDRGLLSDYKVVVLGVDERYGGRALQNMINTTTESGDINLTDAARMLGLYRILNEPDQDIDMPPLQTAIVYTNRVRDSKSFANTFDKLAMQVSDEGGLRCSATHVDGTQNASVRASALQHLRDSASDPGECRILSNAKCLSEGVDVPTLDAVCFMNPKSSKVGIVQAVGRVMRKVDGKDYGYVILPIGIPPNEKAETILDNHNVFDMVWNVLNAMRSHDANMDVEVNTADLRKKMIDKVKVFGVDREGKIRKAGDDPKTYPLGELDVDADALYAKIVEEVGDRRYLEYWAKDVATVVARLQERIGLAITNNTARKKFDLFMKGLRDIINDSITESDGIDMLAQHMVTRRIFDALFGSDDFTKQNPMSAVLDDTVGELQRHGLESEMKDIEGFYASIENRVAGLDTHDARQPVIAELYGKFFKKAFPKMADRLGIVYTPPEIVDFILRSVDHVLRENFGRGLTDKNINIIDPFTGAGTFLARLMSPELGLIQDRDIKRKYKSEMYANEIVLLAYYIAAVNCESAYGYKTGSFKPFSGVSLTDTFNPGNMDEYAGDVMTGPKERIRRQRESPITVIMANPPYSVGQGNANKDNRNTSHPMLEGRLRETYVKRAPKGNKVSLYNSYIKAFRWASDRIGESGVIGFVTPASFITGNAEAGVRACLYGEFTDIWCFNLRGDVKNKDTWKKEGGKIFGSGSKEPIGITILVKNPTKRGCTIHYKQVDDYLTQGEKLDVVRNVGSIMGIEGWEDVFPDKHHYWINQPGLAGEEFERHMCMGSKEVKRGKSVEAMFGTYSRGAATSRDDWVYNTSENELEVNMRRHIDYCNSQDPDNFIINPKQAKSNTSLTERMKRLKNIMFDKHQIRTSLYRPFFKQWLYFDNTFVESKYRIPSFFPSNTSKNLAIMIPDKIKGKFSTFMTNTTPDLHIHEASQCFPIKAKSDIGKKLTPFVTTRNPLRTHSEPTQNPLRTHSEPTQNPLRTHSEPTQNPLRTHSEPTQNPLRTHSEPTQNPLRTHSEPTQNPLRTHSEPTQNPLRTHSEPTQNPLRTHSEPTQNPLRTHSEPTQNPLRTHSEPTQNPLRTHSEPTQNPLRTHSEPTQNPLRTHSEPTQNPLRTHSEPTQNPLRTHSEPTQNPLRTHSEPTQNPLRTHSEPTQNPLRTHSEPTQNPLRTHSEPTQNPLRTHSEPTQNPLRTHSEPTQNPLRTHSEPTQNPLRTHSEPTQNPLRTHSEPTQNPLRTHSEPTQNPLRTHSEPTQNPLRTHSEPTQNPLRTHSEPTQNPLRTHSEPTQNPLNPTIIVPDKIKGEFSVFITNVTPDLEAVHHGQCFPMRVME